MSSPVTRLTPTTLLSSPRSIDARMPCIGFGTWDSPSNVTEASVLSALKAGYRHIDTAQYYANEREVGAAVVSSGLGRKSVFITTKVLTPRGSLEKTYDACLASVNLLDPSAAQEGRKAYVDQFLIHNVLGSKAQREEVWGALEKLFTDGHALSIGVSNWGIGRIEEMQLYAKKVWPPHANQVELHPWAQQRDLVDYCAAKDIGVSAYAPLVRGQKAHHEGLVGIAKDHGKTTAQVLIRYCLQKGWAPLPKSDRQERIKENFDVFDFVLSEEQMKTLDGVRRDDEDDPVVQVASNE